MAEQTTPAIAATPAPQAPQLPTSVVSKVDIGRLIRELQALADFIQAASIREPGTQPKLPRTSKLLDETLELNKLNPLVAEHVTALMKFLVALKETGPTLHMSFSADPSPLFTRNLMTWLRQNIHPHVMLQVGLQPGIGAGCVVRTENKYFDFSLREHFSSQREILLVKLHGAVESPKQEAA